MADDRSRWPTSGHSQELRTINRILTRCVHQEVFRLGSIDVLGELLVEQALIESWDLQEFKRQQGQYRLNAKTMEYFKEQIENDFRARGVLMTWLGMTNEKARQEIYEEEKRFALKEICKRECMNFNIQREEYEQFGFTVGNEEGPHCLFQALLYMENATHIKNERAEKSQASPGDLRRAIVKEMTKNRPEDEILKILNLTFKDKVGWTQHCRGLSVSGYADASVLLAASSYFNANIHIVYMNNMQSDKFHTEENILYASPVVNDRNFYLGYLGRKNYMSLCLRPSKPFYDGFETDRGKMKFAIKEYERKVEDITKELGEAKQKRVKNEKIMLSSDTSTESIKKENEILKKKIESLERELERLRELLKQKEEEHEMVMLQYEQERKDHQKQIQEGEEIKAIMKIEHNEKVHNIRTEFKKLTHEMNNKFELALERAMSQNDDDEDAQFIRSMDDKHISRHGLPSRFEERELSYGTSAFSHGSNRKSTQSKFPTLNAHEEKLNRRALMRQRIWYDGQSSTGKKQSVYAKYVQLADTNEMNEGSRQRKMLMEPTELSYEIDESSVTKQNKTSDQSRKSEIRKIEAKLDVKGDYPKEYEADQLSD